MSYAITADTMSRIEAFLRSENYQEGLRIYHELLGETVLYRMMVRYENSFNARKLVEALTGELNRLKTIIDNNISTEPSSIADLRRMAGKLMDERTALKAQIRMLTDKEQRRERAFRVLDICDELDKVYGQIEFFEKNKMIWEPPTEEVEKEAIVRRYLNLRSYISTEKKALEGTLLKEKKAKISERLKAFKDEKAKLELTEEIQKYLGYVV